MFRLTVVITSQQIQILNYVVQLKLICANYTKKTPKTKTQTQLHKECVVPLAPHWPVPLVSFLSSLMEARAEYDLLEYRDSVAFPGRARFSACYPTFQTKHTVQICIHACKKTLTTKFKIMSIPGGKDGVCYWENTGNS